MEDKLRTLYDNIGKEYSLPDYETFKSDMQNGDNLKRLYDNVAQSYQLPDYDTFVADMGIKKKEFSAQDVREDISGVSLKPVEYSEIPSEAKPKDKLEDRVDAIYSDRNWPSPTKKLESWQNGVSSIVAEAESGSLAPDAVQGRLADLANVIGIEYNPETQEASLSQTELDIYGEQINRAQQQLLSEKADKEKDGFMKDMWEGLNIASHSVMTSPQRALALSERLSSAVIGLVDKKKKVTSTYYQDRAAAETSMVDMWRESNVRYDASITEMIRSGDMAGAAGQSAMAIAENLPILTTLALGNAAGATGAALGFMGFDKGADEYLRSTSDPSLTEASRWINATTKAFSEVVWEKFGTVTILNSVKKGIKEIGEQGMREQLMNAYTPYLQKQMSLAMKGASAMGREAGSEMATQLTDNLMDIALGRDVKLMDGVGDAGIIGGLIGSGLVAPQMIAEYKGGQSEFVKQIVGAIPEDLDFDKKVELAELLVESANIKYEQKNGAPGMDAVNKTRLDEIQTKVGEILGKPTETAPAEVTPEAAPVVEESQATPLKETEEIKAEPLKDKLSVVKTTQVDKPLTGVPMKTVAYHGTAKDFSEFDLTKVEAKDRRLIEGVIWFTNHKEGALAFAGEYRGKPRLIESEIRFDNPLVVDAAKEVQRDLYFKLPNGDVVYDIDYIKERFIRKAKEDGNDGVIFQNARDAHMSGTIYALFDTKQITTSTETITPPSDTQVPPEVIAPPTGETVATPMVTPTAEPQFPEGFTTKSESKTDKMGVQRQKYTLYGPDGKEKISQLTFDIEERNGGKWLSAPQIVTVTGHEKKGYATELYKHALQNLPEGVSGIYSIASEIHDVKAVGAIHKKLAEFYDMETLENGDVIFRPRTSVAAPISTEMTPSTTQGEIVPEIGTPMDEGEGESTAVEPIERQPEPKAAEVLPPVEPPVPPVIEVTEPDDTEGKKRKILERAIEATNVPQDVKDELLARGIEYIPRGRRFTIPEAQAIIDVFKGIDGLDKLAKTVYDLSNDILPDTRTMLNVYIAEQFSKQMEAATDMETRTKLRQKVSDAYMFGAEMATRGGQMVEAQKRWSEIFARDPETLIAIQKRRQSKNNKDALDKMKDDLTGARDFLETNIAQNDEFRKLVEQRVNEEIDKIATKKYGKVDKKKIDDFFSSLEIKTDKMFDATIGLPIAVYNGSLQVIKRAVLAGVDILNAVMQGVDYINKWYKDNYDGGKIDSPEWNKDDYVATMAERLKPLTKKVKQVKYKLPKKAEDNLVEKLYKKMSTATKPQLRRLIRDYVATLEAEGAVSEERFRDLFAKAIGLEVLNTEGEQAIRLAGQSINHARKKADRLMEAFDDYLKEAAQEAPDQGKLKTLEAVIGEKRKEADKARKAAQKSAQQLDKLLQEDITLGQTISTLIQGNLLTPMSLMTNIIGNTAFIPVRGVKTMVASALDYMVYGMAKAYTPMLKRITNPRLAKLAQGLPTPERLYRNMSASKGYAIGFKYGSIEGLKQMVTGQLADDIYRREIARGLDPIKAAIRLRDQLTGAEQAKFDRMLGDFLEAMPGGYMAEFFFRALNLGDKPFRRGAERGRLEEIATIKGLTGMARDRFIASPDAESWEDAKQVGNVSVYQQDSWLSNGIKQLTEKLGKVNAADDHKRMSIMVKTLGLLFKATTMPYVKTPINLVAEALDYAIPMWSTARGVEEMLRGNRRKATDFFAKAIVGQMLITIATVLIREGLLTPPTDDDDKIRQAQYEGERGYSINPDAMFRYMRDGNSEWKDGDRVWSIQRLGVPSMILMGISKAYSDVPKEKMSELGYLQKSVSMIPSILSSSLDQSFLTGVSTGLTAFIEGGPAMDNWLLNTSKALSAAIYPNTIATVSQTFFNENYIREVKDMHSEDERLKRRMINTFKDRMFMGTDLPAKVSVWGEKVLRVPEGRSWPYMLFDVTKSVKYQKSSFGVQMYNMYKRYKEVDEEEAKNILPSLPSASTAVGWDKRNMTPQEVEELQIQVGRARRMYIENFMASEQWDKLTDEERIVELGRIYRETSSRVKASMFMLDIVKESDSWNFLLVNDLIPIPTSSITIRNKRIKGEEAADYYDTVQRYFVEMIEGMPEGKVADDEIEAWLKSIDKKWSRAKEIAKREWASKMDE